MTAGKNGITDKDIIADLGMCESVLCSLCSEIALGSGDSTTVNVMSMLLCEQYSVSRELNALAAAHFNVKQKKADTEKLQKIIAEHSAQSKSV